MPSAAEVAVTAVLGAYGGVFCLDHWLKTRLSPIHFFTGEVEHCDGTATALLAGGAALAAAGITFQLLMLRRLRSARRQQMLLNDAVFTPALAEGFLDTPSPSNSTHSWHSSLNATPTLIN